MSHHRAHEHLSPLIIAMVILLAMLAIAPRFVNLGSRPLMHDESLFGLYSYTAMQTIQSRRDAAANHDKLIYTHMPLMHGPTLMLMTGVVFDRLGDSIALGRGLIALWSMAGLAAMLGLWPRRSRWWLASLLFVSPPLLFYSRFFRDDMFFNAILMLGMAGMARGLSRRPGHIAASVAGVALMMSLLTIMENAIFVYAAGATFAAVYGLFWLMLRFRPGWLTALRCLRPRRRSALATMVELKTPPDRRRRSRSKETYLKPSFEEVVSVPDAPPAPEADAVELPVPIGSWQDGEVWHNVLGWLTGLLLGTLIIALFYGQWIGQAPVQLAAWFPQRLASIMRGLGWMNLLASWQYWAGQHSEQRIAGALHYHLPILVIYELPLLLLIYIGLAWDASLRRGRALFYAGWIGGYLLLWFAWRMIGPPRKGYGAGLVDRGLNFLHISPDASMLALGLLIVPLLAWSLLKLIEHRPLAAWMGWWAACSLFQYSSAGEKVPWLAVHIIVPFYMMAGWIWGPLLIRGNEAARRVLMTLMVFGTLIGLRSDFRLIGTDEANPRERLVFNHTTQRLDTAIKNMLALWSEDADNIPLTQRRVLLVDDPNIGGPSWPGYWYFRHCNNQYTTDPAPLLSQSWDLIVGTEQTLQPLIGKLDRERWNVETMSLRDHWWAPWPDEDRWRNWLNGVKDPLGQKTGLGALLPFSLRLCWRYYWNRDPWTPPGHYPIMVIRPLQIRR